MFAFLDACIIIYLIEIKDDQYEKISEKLFSLRKQHSDLILAASELSLLECRVKPLREKNHELLKIYDQFFAARNLELLPLNRDVIEYATYLRAKYNIRTPDALQAASSLTFSEDSFFITSDKTFKKIENLNVIII